MAFARAAIVTGDGDLSARLVASARAAGVDQTALAPLDAALAIMAGVQGDAGTMAMHRRIDAAGANAARAARDVAILSALGAPVDGQVESFLFANAPQGGVRGESGALLALASAVERGAQGEGALLAVIASGAGPARLDAESVERIVRALRGLRLENEAQHFAIEALVAGAPG